MNLTTTNTTCAGNVATTTIPVDACRRHAGHRGPAGQAAVAGAGRHARPSISEYESRDVRPRPDPDLRVHRGHGCPATPRRVVADTKECLGCHVGSLYQHGNTRVDNVTMCIICHNSASSSRTTASLMGVDASEAYDGLVGQTYEFKTMLHAIHSAGAGQSGPVRDLSDPRHLCLGARARRRRTGHWGDDCRSVDARLPRHRNTSSSGRILHVAQSCQPHNLYHPTYPRDAKQCSACHAAGFGTIPDQSQGRSDDAQRGAAPWKNQIDDTLQGASAAACTTCHTRPT